LLIGVARDAGGLRAELDPVQEADALVTFTDGLNLQILYGRHTAASATAALEHRLDLLRRR
jgi:hypothetical protein